MKFIILCVKSSCTGVCNNNAYVVLLNFCPHPAAHPPLQLVQNCAEHYLTSEHRSIRMEAVRTCAALLVPNLLHPTIFTNPFVTFSAASAQVVGDVLGKLLTVGITDQGKYY